MTVLAVASRRELNTAAGGAVGGAIGLVGGTVIGCS